MKPFRVSFDDPGFAPLQVSAGKSLSLELDARNAPVLFGCRTGICGTCVIDVEGEALPAPDDDEQELLEIMAPDRPKARLACQLNVQCHLRIHPVR